MKMANTASDGSVCLCCVFVDGSSCMCVPSVGPSAALGQTEVLAFGLCGEAVVVAPTAAKPEA